MKINILELYIILLRSIRVHSFCIILQIYNCLTHTMIHLPSMILLYVYINKPIMKKIVMSKLGKYGQVSGFKPATRGALLFTLNKLLVP